VLNASLQIVVMLSSALQARLELEQQRLTGELTASERKLELTSADLAAERDRVAGMAAVMERKVSCLQGSRCPRICAAAAFCSGLHHTGCP
jgi:hypothetical protein